MALLHQAQLRPSKTELIDGWAPSQPWYRGAAGVGLSNIGAFRFDDPEGEVGVETLLVRAGDGPVMQVPLTYRGSPLDGAEASLIGTMEHSVLGRRWVYDGAGDPAYLLTVASAALHGAAQAELVIEVDGELVKCEPTAVVTGSAVDGFPAVPLPSVEELSVRQQEDMTVVDSSELRFAIARVAGQSATMVSGAPAGVLSGTWENQPEPLRLVTVSALPR